VDGQPLPEAALPLLRAARGEALQGLQVEWELNGHHGAALAFSAVMPQMHGRPETVLLALLDVSALRSTERELRRALLAAHAAPLDAARLVEGLRNLPAPEASGGGSPPAADTGQAAMPEAPGAEHPREGNG
jgi:hypothetical protein